MTGSSRRNERKGKGLHRLASGRICAAAPTGVVDLADAVELDWLVTYASSLESLEPSSRRRVAAALLATGCETNPPPPAVAASAVPVSAPSPAAAPAPSAPDAKSFSTSGPLVAEQQADVGAERDGRIVEIDVQIGDHVHAGQLLAKLDDRVAARGVRRAECPPRLGQGAGKRVAIGAANRQSRSAPRRRRCATKRSSARKSGSTPSTEWMKRLPRLSATAARRARPRRTWRQRTCNWTQSRIVAPFSGVIGRSSVRPDQQVKAGDVLFWITAEAPLHVLFTVPETLMASFTAGSAA